MLEALRLGYRLIDTAQVRISDIGPAGLLMDDPVAVLPE